MSLELYGNFSMENSDFPKNSDPIDENDVGGLGYDDLPDDLRLKLDVYPLDIIVLDANGRRGSQGNVPSTPKREQTLKSQENETHFQEKCGIFVKSLVQHPSSKSDLLTQDIRSDLIAAQMICSWD